MEPGPVINLKHFGEIDLGKEYKYNNILRDIDFRDKGINVSIDLSDLDTPDPGRLAALEELFENLEAYDDHNLGEIKSDFEAGGEATTEYIAFCLDYLGEDCLSRIINFSNSREEQEQEVIAKLWLMEVYITLVPEQSHLIFFNYGLNNETYDYLSIYRDDKGQFQSLSVEG